MSLGGTTLNSLIRYAPPVGVRVSGRFNGSRKGPHGPATECRGFRDNSPMRAVVQHRYGPPDVLYIADVERPVPKDGEVLIRIRASTVSQSDTHARAAHPFFWRLVAGVRRPKPGWRTLGVELAGEVEAVGSTVRGFRVGDRVFGSPWFGAHAEFICLPETGALAHMPEGMSFEEAAAICDGAFQALSTRARPLGWLDRRLSESSTLHLHRHWVRHWTGEAQGHGQEFRVWTPEGCGQIPLADDNEFGALREAGLGYWEVPQREV